MTNLYKQIAGDKSSIGKIVKIIEDDEDKSFFIVETLFKKSKGFKYKVNKYVFRKYYEEIKRTPK